MQEQILPLYALLCRDAARCHLFALRAIKEGRPGQMHLLEAIGLSLTRQANRLLLQVRGGIGDGSANRRELLEEILERSCAGYDLLQQQAMQHNHKALGVGARHGRAVQLKNRTLLTTMTGSPEEGYYVCNFCGFIASSAAPTHCPVCTAPARRFDRIGP